MFLKKDINLLLPLHKYSYGNVAACQAGMKSLTEEGILKVLAGVTSIEEVIRVTTDDALPE